MSSGPGQQKNLLARNSILNLMAKILPMFAGVATIPYIVKGLGTDGFGILSIAWMLLGYFSIFDLGLSRATTKFVAEHTAADKVHKLPGLVWTALGLELALGTAAAILLTALVPVASTRFFHMPAAFVPQARMALFILCASVPVLLISDALRGVLEAAQRFDLVNYVTVPASISFYLLAAAAIPFNVGVPGIVTLLVMCRLLSLIAFLLLSFKVFPVLRHEFKFSRDAVRPLTSFGGWVMLSNIAGPIFGYLERFLIASILSVSALTFYSAPFELVSRVLIFPASITAALFPFFSYHGSRGGEIVSDVTSRTLKYLLLVLTPVTTIFVFFAHDILQIWLGADFATRSTVALQLLAVSFFLNALAMVPFTSVQALGRPDLKAYLDMVALPTYVVSTWWLLHHLGINGGALSKLLITVLDSGCLFFFSWKLKALSLRDFASGSLYRSMIASLGLALTVWLIKVLSLGLMFSGVLLVFAGLAYLATFWKFAVEEDENASIQQMFRGFLRLPPRLSEASIEEAVTVGPLDK